MGRAKALMMEMEDRENVATHYLIDHEKLVSCEIYDEVYCDEYFLGRTS